MPTTATTVTSNVTADKPGAASQSSPDPFGATSTSEMQKRISTNLRSTGTLANVGTRLAKSLRAVAPESTETYITYGLTEMLFKSCADQAPYTIADELRTGIYTGKGPPKNAREEDVGVPDGPAGANSWWFKTLELEPTFSVWSQVCFLHMYILIVKLRTLPYQKSFMDHQRYLLEHFSNAAEDKMALLHGMSARGIRNKYLKELFIQWRGITYAYDEGMVGGDAVLAAAVWRNLWKADENVDWEKVAMVVAFMRRSIAGMADESVNNIAGALNQGSKYWQLAQEDLDKAVRRESKEMRASSS